MLREGLQDQIEVIEGDAMQVTLPEKAFEAHEAAPTPHVLRVKAIETSRNGAF